MMSRKFTKRETILLIIFAVLLIGLVYYYGVWNQSKEALATYNTMDLEDELTVEQAKAMSKQNMQKEIDSGDMKANGVVASYNNITNEISALNDILSMADTYTLDFSEAQENAGTVRRSINVTFHAGSYATVTNMLQQLHDCQYRCLIQDVAISSSASSTTGIKEGSDLNVSLTVTFYETTYNSDSTAGLKLEEKAPESTEPSTQDAKE